MKNLPLLLVFGISLSLPVFAHDVPCSALFAGVPKFLVSCGVEEKEAAVFHKLDVNGRIRLALIAQGKDCKNAKAFKTTRKYIKLWDPDFLTKAERETMDKITTDIINKLLNGMGGK